MRGGETSAYGVHPDVGLAFDVTHATDYPGIDKAKRQGDVVCGGGPVIARGPNINPVVFDRLVAAAEAEGIAYQIEAEPGVTGTDARAIQIARGGIPCRARVRYLCATCTRPRKWWRFPTWKPR